MFHKGSAVADDVSKDIPRMIYKIVKKLYLLLMLLSKEKLTNMRAKQHIH